MVQRVKNTTDQQQRTAMLKRISNNKTARRELQEEVRQLHVAGCDLLKCFFSNPTSELGSLVHGVVKDPIVPLFSNHPTHQDDQRVEALPGVFLHSFVT
jgi:hypothetical protein